MKIRYLHESSPGIYFLDHKLTPEVRAMFASMASRLPAGGIRARYAQVVDFVASELWTDFLGYAWEEAKKKDIPELNLKVLETWYTSEDRLCEYPLHPRVQNFFDEFVGKYGHSSIQEQTGEPAVYVEDSSWFTNWLMFDSPLVAGQEFSTRAVQKKDWPMAREGRNSGEGANLVSLHKDWMQLFELEANWWKDHLSDPKNREALGVGDKEPFRPALDRARWALPGTISLGACFTSNVRERARVIRDASLLKEPQDIWSKVTDAYKEALPGISVHAFREVSPEHQVPEHLQKILCPVAGVEGLVDIRVSDQNQDLAPVKSYVRKGVRTYEDPWANHEKRTYLRIECSLAAARDWHRHRTMYPWHLGVVLDAAGNLQLDRHYTPMSEEGKRTAQELLQRSSEAFSMLYSAGDIQRAALALPLGSRVVVSGSGGYRDAKYMLELRAFSHGANFEYRGQALEALSQIDPNFSRK